MLSNNQKSSVDPLNNQPKSRIFYYGWVILGVCLFISLIAMGIRFSFGVFFKSIEETFSLSRTSTSGVTSLAQFLACGICFMAGWALDRYGPRKTFLVSSVLAGAGLLLTSQVNSLWQLYIAYSLLFTLGSGGINTLGVAITSRWFPQKRGLTVGILSTSACIGLMGGSTIVATLIQRYGWQNSFFILGIIVIAIWVPCSLLLKRASAGNQPGAMTGTIGAFQGYSLSEASKTWQFWLWVFLAVMHALTVFIILTHIVPHAIDLGISAIQAAAILTIIGAVGLIGRLVTGRVVDLKSDLRSRKIILVIGTTFQIIAPILLLFVSNTIGFYLFAILFGAGYGSMPSAWYALVGDIFGMRHFGAIIGALDAAFGVGAALGPVLAGWIFDSSQSYNYVFILCAVVMLLSLVPIMAIKSNPALNRQG